MSLYRHPAPKEKEKLKERRILRLLFLSSAVYSSGWTGNRWKFIQTFFSVSNSRGRRMISIFFRELRWLSVRIRFFKKKKKKRISVRIGPHARIAGRSRPLRMETTKKKKKKKNPDFIFQWNNWTPQGSFCFSNCKIRNKTIFLSTIIFTHLRFILCVSISE